MLLFYESMFVLTFGTILGRNRLSDIGRIFLVLMDISH